MSDFDQYLSDHLQRQAAGMDIPAGDTGTVMARGRARQHRRRATAAVAVVAAGATATAVAVSTSAHGPAVTRVLAPSPSSSVPASSNQLSWQSGPATAGLYMTTSLTGSTADQYAVSTGPGVAATGTSPAYLYRSTDGSTWTVVGMASDSNSLADVTASGGTIYAVGTGVASARAGQVENVSVEASTDGGPTWSAKVLPLDLSAPNGALTVSDNSLKVASGPAGVVAAVGVNLNLDLTKVLPSGVAVSNWAATPTGVDLLGAMKSDVCGAAGSPAGQAVTSTGQVIYSAGPATEARIAALKKGEATIHSAGGSVTTLAGGEGSVVGQVQDLTCVGPNGDQTADIPADQAYAVTGSYSWSSLGVSPQAALELQGEPVVFYAPGNFYASADSSFTQVDLPASVQSGGMEVAGGDGGFALTGSGGPGDPANPVLVSPDGKEWTSAPALPSAAQIGGLGYLGDRLVALSLDQGTNSTAYTLAGPSWTAATVPCQLDSVAFGPLGVAVVGASTTDSSSEWTACFSANGSDWSSSGSLQKLSGGPVDDAEVVVTADHVVVTVTRPPTDPNVAASQAAVVGSLTAG